MARRDTLKLASIALLLFSGCTESKDGSEGVITTSTQSTSAMLSSSTTVATTTTSTVVEITTTTIDLIDEDVLVYSAADPTSVEAELETAYHRSWDAYDAVLADPNGTHPELELVQVDDALAATLRAGQQLADSKRFAIHGPTSRHIVMGITLVDSSTGLVESCEISDGQFFQVDEPETKVSGEIFTVQFSMTLIKEGGTWKSARLDQTSIVKGIGGCASFELSSS